MTFEKLEDSTDERICSCSNGSKRHSVLGTAYDIVMRVIGFPMLVFCKAMIKLEDYGLFGLLLQLATIIAVPMVFVLSMIFLPIPPILKAIISIYTFLTWGLLRQAHTDLV